MATIYIDATNGNDTTGAGTSGNPYASLSKAFTVVAAGDVIKIANTGVQSFATLAYPAIVTTSDAWLVIEGWNNGGAQVIENPAGDFTDVGVIEGRITGTLAFVKWKKIKFQNVSITTNPVVSANTDTVYEYCDFNGITITSGAILTLNARSAARFCSFRNITATVGTCITFNSTPCRAFDCYFYNIKNGVHFGNQNGNIVEDCFLDLVSGFGMRVEQGDNNLIKGNTIVGDNSTASATGILFISTAMEAAQVYNNHIQDFSGSGSIGISAAGLTWPTTKGTFDIMGNNSFYNNATDKSLGTNFADSCMTDLTGDDIVETSDPLVDKSGKNYSKNGTAASSGRTSIPKGINYSETYPNQTTGAAQNMAVVEGYAGV